jgi:hypothetical protein
LLPALVAVCFDHRNCDVIQFPITEKQPQIVNRKTVTPDGVFRQPGKVWTFELFAQKSEPDPFARLTDLEQSHRDLAFTSLPDLLGELFASRLGCAPGRLENVYAHVKKPNIPVSNAKPAHNKKQDAQLRALAKALSRMNDKDRRLLLHMASKWRTGLNPLLALVVITVSNLIF